MPVHSTFVVYTIATTSYHFFHDHSAPSLSPWLEKYPSNCSSTLAPPQLIPNRAAGMNVCKCKSDHTPIPTKPSSSFLFQSEERPKFFQRPATPYTICTPPIASTPAFHCSAPRLLCSTTLAPWLFRSHAGTLPQGPMQSPSLYPE